MKALEALVIVLALVGTLWAAALARRWWEGYHGLNQWPDAHGRYYTEWLRLPNGHGDYYAWLARKMGNREPWRTWAERERATRSPIEVMDDRLERLKG